MSKQNKGFRRTVCWVAIVFAFASFFAQEAKAANQSDVDPKTGMVFPTAVGVFHRDGGIKYDTGGFPTASYWAGRMILVDVFYYKDKPFEIEYANCRDYVKIVTTNSRLISEERSNLHPGGRRAIFTCQRQFAGGPNIRVESQLLMFPHRDRYVAFRASYPATNAGRARPEIDSFIQMLKFP